jgi:hypothetical protein
MKIKETIKILKEGLKGIEGSDIPMILLYLPFVLFYSITDKHWIRLLLIIPMGFLVAITGTLAFISLVIVFIYESLMWIIEGDEFEI